MQTSFSVGAELRFSEKADRLPGVGGGGEGTAVGMY